MPVQTQRLSEQKPDHQHIAQCAGKHGKQSVALPQMNQCGNGDADQFGNTEGLYGDGYILQAVHHQHRKYGGRKRFAEICDDRRHMFRAAEQNKRQKPCQHGRGSAEQNRNDLLGNRLRAHRKPPFSAIVRRKRSRKHRITHMDGMMKLSAPNSSRQKKDAPNPIRDER